MCIINSIKLYSCVNFNKQKSIDFILLALNLMCGAAPLHRTQLNQNDEEKSLFCAKPFGAAMKRSLCGFREGVARAYL